MKTYTCEHPEAKVDHLRKIYGVLETRNIPNTDVLLFAKQNVAHFGPRGIAGQPLVEKELRQCLECLLKTLIAAHQVPVYHRDIRWENVVRRIDDRSTWLLVNWEDAAEPPTKAETSFSCSSHSAAIFSDDHEAEVDIWGVGYLIETCTARDVSTELRALFVWNVIS
ncbi:hypothetical protein H0H81_002000 [Sphagnurus paluster]|uniref:Protein kinase domain-containing protein n=1 Tax=Sphagnurus paluster TaxID=117069 RepID=A0A9P7KJZ4_9AGAR|nr:hypothetical protein H0H81_002000 [Sphagnurus paluster]